MTWKQPIPTNLPDLTKGDAFAATILAILILRATNKESVVYAGDTPITLKRGQCIVGRYELAKCLGMKQKESLRIQRILTKLENSLQLINKRKSKDCSVITIKNYDDLTKFEPSDEPSVNNQRTISEPSMNTNKSVKSEKNVNILPSAGFEKTSEENKQEESAEPVKESMRSMPVFQSLIDKGLIHKK